MIQTLVTYAGRTPLRSTLTLSQTGPMELTVSAGEFQTTGNPAMQLVSQVYQYPASVISVTAHPTEPKRYLGELIATPSGPEILVRSRLGANDWPLAPAETTWVQSPWFQFVLAPGTTILDNVLIYVFTVAPGFPDGPAEHNLWLF